MPYKLHHRLGVRMALLGRDYLVGPFSDPEMRKSARGIFADEFEFYPHGEVTRMAHVGDAVEIDYVQDGSTRTQRFDNALVATGRRPNTDGLELGDISIPCDEWGVPIYDPCTMQCGETPIFIAGDATNTIPLLHEAADESRIAGCNAEHWPEIRAFGKSAPLGVVFSDPQIMTAGRGYHELTEAGIPFETGEVDWSDQGRSRVMLINKGLLRVYGERGTGGFLGADRVGPRAGHLAHLLAWACQSNLTVGEMLERPFYLPVVDEGLRTALRMPNAALAMGPSPIPSCLDCGSGA